MAEYDIQSEFIISRLFSEGQYAHVLQRIFMYLDGTSLHSAGLVSKGWREFIKQEVWGSAYARKWFWKGWRLGVPATRRLELGTESCTMIADPETIVCGLSDGRVDVYSRNTLTRISLLSGHVDCITTLSMDTRLIVSGSWDGKIKIWCRVSSECLFTIPSGKGCKICKVHLDSPLDQGAGLIRQLLYVTTRNGKVMRYALLASQPTKNDPSIKLIREPQVESFKLEHDDPVSCCEVGVNHILVGSTNSMIYLWDKRREAKLKTLKRHKNAIRCLHLAYPLALSGSKDKTAILWDLDTDQSIIITTDHYKDIYLWDLEKPHSRKESCIRALTGHNGPVHSLHCEQGVLISCDVTGVLLEKDFWSCVEDGPGMRILRCTDGINCMVCDNTQIVVGLVNKNIEVYDRKSLHLVRLLAGHEDHVWSVDMNTEYVVSGSWDSSVRIWSRENGRILFIYVHPHGREISGVKILRNQILVTSLAGSLNIIECVNETSFRITNFFPGSPELGEIYSLSCDRSRILTGHTLNNKSFFKLWNTIDFSVEKIITEDNNPAIIWSVHLQYPIALVCRDNEVVDIYNLEKDECVKSLRHESKVLCATIYEGKIICGCQFGLLVIWNITSVMASDKKTVSMSGSQSTLYEHSAAISNIYVDTQELITHDYDGIVILRNLRHYKKFSKVFRRAPQVDFKQLFDEMEEEDQQQQ
ncbi:F-box/WD repeat-containing protein 11 [Eurytemora carolleeae]|uniref:F-box/WD repeat-containing protein 11 n=1 Tax=Eurytemora carolleeae TaxID=1294199 RepID=UPI000C7780F4|nr:F-box/WD repeat-containing protein 11 [Eurytemora carolleeae]|eukprot:XP_023331508.1 F-box/WD repeat-containing protein 11-like [Eurytemora affinis]